MLTVNAIEDIPSDLPHPIALTLGSFDGIHLGHQALFKQLKQRGPTSVVLTFSNHPATVLTPENASSPIYSLEEKCALIESCGIDVLILLPFTRDTASHTYDEYLLYIRRYLPFDYLVLGSDARLGKGRTGTPERIRALGEREGFGCDYLDKLKLGDLPISSRHIRDFIAAKNYTKASAMLGRPYP